VSDINASNERLRTSLQLLMHKISEELGGFHPTTTLAEEILQMVEDTHETRAHRLMNSIDVLKCLRGERIDGRSDEDLKREAAREIERLQDGFRRVRRLAAQEATHTGLVAALGVLSDRVLNPGHGPLPPEYTYRHETLAPRQVTLTGYALKAALEFSAPDMSPDQLETEVNIQWGDEGHSGAGYYACIAEYPEEGSIMLHDGADRSDGERNSNA
jgi:hypothetical protein